MYDITDFLTHAQYRFSTGNLEFAERVQRLLSYLKAEGVLPVKRAQQTYPAHRSFTGAILVCLDTNETLVRRHFDHTIYSVFGLPTRSEIFLALMEQKKMLRPTSEPNVYRLDPKLRYIVPALTDQEAVNV